MLAAVLQRLGRAGDARRLSGRAPADHRSGVAFRLQHVEDRSRSSAARFPPTSSATTRSARRRAPQIGKEAYDLYVQQQCCGGLNFGYFYAGSPIIAYDGAAHPAYSMGQFKSSTVPGCRAPHFWLRDGRSLYDALGEGYGLIRFDTSVAVGWAGRGGEASAACRSTRSRHRRCRCGSALREEARAGAARPACRLARRRRAGRCAGIDRPSARRAGCRDATEPAIAAAPAAD